MWQKGTCIYSAASCPSQITTSVDFSLPEATECLSLLPQAQRTAGEGKDPQAARCCWILQGWQVSSGKLALSSTVEKCLKHTTAIFFWAAWPWDDGQTWSILFHLHYFKYRRLFIFDADLKLQQRRTIHSAT